jgi:hypothetical protein
VEVVEVRFGIVLVEVVEVRFGIVLVEVVEVRFGMVLVEEVDERCGMTLVEVVLVVLLLTVEVYFGIHFGIAVQLSPLRTN